MHRQIDSFTDNHEISKRCRELLRPATGKFAGVALDLIYDHILAKNWSAFSEVMLEDFATDIYRILNLRYSELTMENRVLLGYMTRDNWLVRYRSFEGTALSLDNMSKRLAYKNNLDEAMNVYNAHRSEIDALGVKFLKEIQVATSAFTSLDNID